MTPKSTHPNRSRRRATTLLAACSMGLILASLAPGAAGGIEEEFVAGSGKADARILNVGPRAAKLSLAPTLGVALADYLSTLGRGESLVFDYVALDGSIPAEMKEALPPLRAESTAKAECRDRVRTTPSGSPVGAMEQRSRATAAGPLGTSSFRLGSFTIPGAIELGNAIARSNAGIVDGKTRRAEAITEIGELSLGGGAVKITGLRWRALQETGASKKTSGSFSIEALKIGGAAIPIPDGSLESVIGPINTALLPLGIALAFPQEASEGGVARISPLGIQVFESPLRAQLLGPLFGGIHPVRQPVIDELLGMGEQFDEAAGTGGSGEVTEGDREVTFVGCPGDPQPANAGESSGAYDYTAVGVLVTDITLGALTGVSSLNLVLGGASAVTEGERFDSPFAPGGLKAPPAPVIQTIPGVPGVAGTPGDPGGEADVGDDVQALPVGEGTQAGSNVPGDTGGVALWIGLVGLFLAFLIGGTDWYLIRRAREILPVGPST